VGIDGNVPGRHHQRAGPHFRLFELNRDAQELLSPPVSLSQGVIGSARLAEAIPRPCRLFAFGWSMLAGRGSAQIIYWAAADRQSAPHAGVISPPFLLPLGYEHRDIRLPGLYTVLVRPADQPSLPAAGAGLKAVFGVSASLVSESASRSGSWPGQPGAWALLPTPCPAGDSTAHGFGEYCEYRHLE
jgi:hypothetical protein